MPMEKRIMAAFAKDCEQHPRKFIHCQEYDDPMQSQFIMVVGAKAADMGVDFENVEIFEMVKVDPNTYPMQPIEDETDLPKPMMTKAEEDRIADRWFGVGSKSTGQDAGSPPLGDRLVTALEMSDLKTTAETVVVLAVAPDGERIRHTAKGEYTADAVIGEICGEVISKVRKSGEDHFGYVLHVHFERNGKRFSIMD